MTSTTDHPLRPFVGPGRVLAGPGASARAADELRAIGVETKAGAVLVVADAVVLDLGLAGPALESLEAGGYDVIVGPGVAREPAPDTVETLLAAAEGRPVSAVLAIGGGSAIDAAKLVAVGRTNNLPLTQGLPATAELRAGAVLSAIPTTAGTGAEATAVAMLWHECRKRIFVHERLVPRHAILDPDLLAGLPAPIMAASGLDAISHAVESLLSTFRTPLTSARSLTALGRLVPALPVAHREGDPQALEDLLLGAHEAGLALNASVVVGHSLAYAIAARTGLSHGVTCAMALPYCLAYCRPACEHEIARLGTAFGVDEDAAEVFNALLELTASLEIPLSLAAVGIGRDELPAMAADCLERYPRPNNPVPLSEAPLTELLDAFHEGAADRAWASSAPREEVKQP
jgi:alcohol dehydrogenase class IV